MKKNVLILSLALFSMPSFAADLLAAWRAAQQYDPSFSAARYAQIAGSEKKQQGQSLLLPTVTLGANVAHSDNEYLPGNANSSISSTQSGHGYNYGVTATQPIYRVDAFASADQLKTQAKLADVAFKAAEQDLILRVAKTYFEVLAADEKVALAIAEKKKPLVNNWHLLKKPLKLAWQLLRTPMKRKRVMTVSWQKKSSQKMI
ncbi:TolC family protein [Deefgea sp. CFH1-16]|uniref:TolC family protein n=1 Tax=Deefgea sp. CFH1-16 TaxID=2675457 RepID=UPI0015F6B19D|nr:TolC family protein [Deefgea sp. CFH1-16]MBM5574622.1 hypothetical protein [Deefgea sp. CFH1-16]